MRPAGKATRSADIGNIRASGRSQTGCSARRMQAGLSPSGRRPVTGTKVTPVVTNSSGSFFPCFWLVAWTVIARARDGSFSTGANSHVRLDGVTLKVLVR